MLDALLKPKFYNKCKVAIKLTKARLEVINKKRSAMLKFLNNDITDLLQNGLDYHAYGRVEGLIVEQNMTCCYNFLHDFCGCILTHLSNMLKHSECPEECREAVSSLAFAAARFADLPELRDLRTLFCNKYGTSIDHFVNKEFASRLRPQPPSKEMKVQLMRNIALDISLKWDSKALEQKLFTPPPPPPPAAVTNVQKVHTMMTHQSTREGKDTTEFPTPMKKCSSNNRRERRNALPNSVNEVGAQRRDEPKGNHKLPSSSSKAGADRDSALLKLELTTKKEAAAENAPLPEEKGVENKKLPSSSYRNIPPPYLITAKPEKGRSKEQVPAAKAKQQLEPRSVRQIRRQLPQQLSHIQPHEEDQKKGTESLSGALPLRVASLPPEAVKQEAADWRKPHHNLLRATTSLQHDGHVHPKLPDYDDLTTRMASLRKR